MCVHILIKIKQKALYKSIKQLRFKFYSNIGEKKQSLLYLKIQE
jgi:hypothetical protein